MSALAGGALVLVLAAWVRPRLAAARGRAPGRAPRLRQRSPTADEWAAVLDGVSAEVRTGSSLAVALQQALVRSQPHGQSITPSTTLASIAATIATAEAADPDEAVVVQAISAAHSLGGPAAATIDAASALLRERSAIRGEALAHSAQARLSARVLTGVPLTFAGWSLLSSRSFRTALLSEVGLASALIGATCNLIGWWWMRRIVAKVSA
jgi:Flp pilus assembly protein TadB